MATSFVSHFLIIPFLLWFKVRVTHSNFIYYPHLHDNTSSWFDDGSSSNESWSVVLVDQLCKENYMKMRMLCVLKYIPLAQVVVLHDSEHNSHRSDSEFHKNNGIMYVEDRSEIPYTRMYLGMAPGAKTAFSKTIQLIQAVLSISLDSPLLYFSDKSLLNTVKQFIANNALVDKVDIDNVKTIQNYWNLKRVIYPIYNINVQMIDSDHAQVMFNLDLLLTNGTETVIKVYFDVDRSTNKVGKFHESNQATVEKACNALKETVEFCERVKASIKNILNSLIVAPMEQRWSIEEFHAIEASNYASPVRAMAYLIKTEGYCTHMPSLLSAVIGTSKGRVLELGSGYCSTPVLHKLVVEKHERMLVTADSDEKWLSKFYPLGEHSLHQLLHAPC
jgi:hypothetical protein